MTPNPFTQSPLATRSRVPQNTRSVVLANERVVYQFCDTSVFWKVVVTHEYPDATPGYTEEIITTREILNQYRLYVVSLSPSPSQSAVPCGTVEVPGRQEFADVEEFVNHLMENLYAAGSSYPGDLVVAAEHI